ncbi:protein WVD2-like 7 isoform X2 [Phoenix dactylifera]|uniref:Protein WVD2-like 7 isoform X2 n=1 Tax=Phoenix dactylifera TaxID=42345 RepID=A0A8B9AST6_PHODC|nr:protein WVD2-like 7 isoform X2 [Phoenix dactylifera]
MATDIGQTYNGWSHDKLSDHDDSQEVSMSQMLDHGSISFGRFAVESLSWERRSVFTCNRRQEELEKFRAPGLVAQKKAFFEEYYQRIRAMKALQENQQTELPSDHGGDDSISSQTGEEDETATQLESLRNGVANASNACLKKAAVGVASEKGKSFNETLQIKDLNDEIVTPSEKSLEEIEEEKNSGYAHQMETLDTESSVHVSLVKSKEEIDQHELGGLDDGGISRKYENSACDATTVEASQRTALFSVDSNPENSEHWLVDNTAVGKMKSGAKRHTEKRVSVPKVKKEPAALVRNGLKLDCKSKSELKSTQRPKYPSQGTISRTDNSIVSSKTHADRVSSNYRSTSVCPAALVRNGLKLDCKSKSEMKSTQRPKYPSQGTIRRTDNSIVSSKTHAERVSSNYRSTSVVSHRQRTELHFSGTVPRPFSFATEKRAAVPSGIREGTQRLDPKTLNKSAPSLNHAKDVSNVQVTSKKSATTTSVKSRGSENKRGSGEIKRMHLASDSKTTVLRGGGITMLGPPKARSINLPARDKSDTNGGTVSRSIDAVRRNKKKEEKFVARCMPEVHGVNTKSFAPHLTGNLRTESKKMVQSSQPGNLLVNGRKAQFGDLSFDGRRPRQMMPQWR